MTQRETIDTTYADLRSSDLVIDKSGQAWPIAELKFGIEFEIDGSEVEVAAFWLCDPVTSVKMHLMEKRERDAVKVSRLPTQADEAARLEAEFPTVAESLAAAGVKPTGNHATIEEALDAHDSNVYANAVVSLEDAVAAVEEIGGTVEAEVTAAEVDAAAAATDDAPVSLPPFADMTPLEQRSHLYLLHGLYGSDVTGKAELVAIHGQAHTQHDAGTLNSRHVPHQHEVAS